MELSVSAPWDLTTELEHLRKTDRYRVRQLLEGPQGVERVVQGRSCLEFCSNDYLGLASHPKVIAALQKGAQTYGVGSGSAHLVAGHCKAHHALEEELADFVGQAQALSFSTGYMANIGVITALLGPADAIYQDRYNHASLLDGGRLSQARLRRFPHRDTQALATMLKKGNARRRLIVTDGVFSMEGDIAPLPELAALARRNNVGLMVDDAHGLGVLGPQGRGTAASLHMSAKAITVLVGTFGKALGTFGAFVAGSQEVIEYLIQKARPYIFTTAPPAALVEATRASLQLVKEEGWRRDQLRILIQHFRQGAEQLGLPLGASTTPIQWIAMSSDRHALALSQALYKAGFHIQAIRPPTVPEGTARLRIGLSAAHSVGQVDRLLEALAQHWQADAPTL